MDGDVDGVHRARLRENRAVRRRFQPLDDGFFGNRLTVADAHQLTADALAGHVDFRVGGHDVLPRDGLDQLEQLLERPAFVLRQHDEHAVGAAQAQIAQERVCERAREARTAEFRADILHFQALEFRADDALQPECGGGVEVVFVMIHDDLLLYK